MYENYFIKIEIQKFKEHAYKSRWYILIYVIFFLAVYGGWIYNTYPHVDTEIFIDNPYK